MAGRVPVLRRAQMDRRRQHGATSYALTCESVPAVVELPDLRPRGSTLQVSASAPTVAHYPYEDSLSTDPTTVRAARLLISQLGLTPEDLMWVPVDVPTFGDYVPHVIAASGTGAKRTYGTYWTRITETFGDRRLDDVTPSMIEGLMRRLVENRRIRRNDCGGHSVAEHLLAAMRAVYNRAINDNLLPPQHNPAGRVPKPRRRPTTRQALSASEVTALADAVTTGGHDAVLDTLLFRLHLETACRRGASPCARVPQPTALSSPAVASRRPSGLNPDDHPLEALALHELTDAVAQHHQNSSWETEMNVEPHVDDSPSVRNTVELFTRTCGSSGTEPQGRPGAVGRRHRRTPRVTLDDAADQVMPLHFPDKRRDMP